MDDVICQLSLPTAKRRMSVGRCESAVVGWLVAQGYKTRTQGLRHGWEHDGSMEFPPMNCQRPRDLGRSDMKCGVPILIGGSFQFSPALCVLGVASYNSWMSHIPGTIYRRNIQDLWYILSPRCLHLVRLAEFIAYLPSTCTSMRIMSRERSNPRAHQNTKSCNMSNRQNNKLKRQP